MLGTLKRFTRTACVFLAACLAGCCASTTTVVSPLMRGDVERLGPAEGSAAGSLLLHGTAYNFIPIMLNSRVERAYNAAVASVPGATGLVDVSYEESWFWWVLGSTRRVTITGEAVR